MTEATGSGHSARDMSEPLADIEGTFSAIYRDHFEFAWASLRRLGVPPGAEEDALQDLFMVVYRRRSEFAGRSSLKTWIFGVARKVAARYRRTEQRRYARHERFAAVPVEPLVGVEEALARDQALGLLEAFLAELEPRQRRVFELHVLEDMSGPQIAEAMGLNLNTVYSRLRLAREQFERRLPIETRGVALAAGRGRAPAATRQRVWAALLVQFGGGELALTVKQPVGQIAAAAVKGLCAVGLAATVWIVHLSLAPLAQPAVAGARDERDATAAPDRASVPDSAPTLSVTPTEMVESEISAPPRPLRRSATRAPRSSAVPSPSEAEALAAETALIARVWTAIAARRDEQALTLLAQHAREFPLGVLMRERHGFRAIALCRLGNGDEGRAAAAMLAELAPSGTLQAQVRAACTHPE